MALITVRSAPTIEQIVRVQVGFLKVRLRWILVAGWLLVAVMLVQTLVEITTTNKTSTLIPAIALVLYLVAVPIVLKSMTRRRFLSPKNRVFMLPTIYEIDENEIQQMSEGGSSAITPWTGIVEVRPWSGGYLLMLSELTFLIFYPGRFATAEEWEQFLALARRRPSGKKL